jgi:hypothetical protein
MMTLAEEFPDRWTLIGAYMVALHAWGSGMVPPRRSDEADLVLNLRVPDMTARMLADRLVEIGWRPEPGRNGTLHRFARDELALDVFGPEHLGERVAQKFEAGVGRLLEVPGGRQALERSWRQPIRSADREGWVPLPSLLAAVLLKSRAYFKRIRDLNRQADLQDLTFLLDLASATTEPMSWVGEFQGQQRNWLRRVARPLLESRTAWSTAGRPDRAQRFLEHLL